jgi:hypothetical protein
MGMKMYSIAQRAKAAVLRNEIIESELLYSTAIPDSLREEQNRLSGNIAAYNNLILEESRKITPDSNRIFLWKDALFRMNRDKEKVTDEINKEVPQYHDLLQKTEPVPLSEIQRHLHRDETIIDYLLSNQYKNGKRDLYIFLITRDNLEFRETGLDSLFLKNTEIIRKADNKYLKSEFRAYTNALSYMYEKLIKPVEGSFAGDRLMIIPDEEIAWLPFDAFLANSPGAEQTDYEGLQYLINNYTISYSYSSKEEQRYLLLRPITVIIKLPQWLLSSFMVQEKRLNQYINGFGAGNSLVSRQPKRISCRLQGILSCSTLQCILFQTTSIQNILTCCSILTLIP